MILQRSTQQVPHDLDSYANGDESESSNPTLLNSTLWQQQVQLAQMSRQTNNPHNYARTAASMSHSGSNGTSQAFTVTELAQKFVQTATPPSQSGNATNNGHGHASSGSASNINSGGMPTSNTGGAKGDQQRLRKEQLEDERQRRINEEVNKQFWTGLDLSGQGLSGLSDKLFRYDFLQKLYLCHNRLTRIPPAVTRLKQLKVLDLSDNLIAELPAELGLLYSLRYLFLFDNRITELPFEFGYLFQLDILGIEGNPLPESVKELMAQEGTNGVIISLRENAPVTVESPPREWLMLEDDERGAVAAKEEPAEEASASSSTAAVASDESESASESQGVTRAAAAKQVALSAGSPDGISVMSYNTLCDRYASPQLYGYTPSWALGWKYRSELLRAEVLNYETDVVSLQEVDGLSFDGFWTPTLAAKGYKSLYWPKTRARTLGENEAKKVDGSAIFYKAATLKLLERHAVEYNSMALRKDDLKKTADIYNRVMNKDNIALIAVFENIAPNATPGQLLVMVNTHLHWDPVYEDVKLVQVGLMLEEVERILDKYASNTTVEGSKYPRYTDPKNIPLIVCGDFNSKTDSGVYKLFSQGEVSGNHPDLKGRVYGKYTEEGISHKLQLKSSYADVGEMPFSNFTPNFVELIDYIWFSTPSLTVTGVLGPLDSEYTSKFVGIPNPHHPSDHIPLVASFGFKKQKEPVAKPAPPKFGSRKT